jgi:hypothetical protein
VTAGWVAAGVRGRALLRRRLGQDETARLAASRSLGSALAALETTSYGREIRPGQDLAAAQHAVSATALWHLRVLAGWGPPLGAGPLRILGSGFEIANVTGRLLALSGAPARTPYALGSLATVWPGIAAARSPAELRAVLRSSPWGDPGSDELPVVRVSLQLAWARRVLDGVPGAADWAIAGAALTVARTLATGTRSSLGATASHDVTHVLGPDWWQATSISELGGQVPPAAARALQGVHSAHQLWQAEARWWAAVEAAATPLAARPRPDASSGVGVAVLLAADAWRLRAALALAEHGGGNLAEVLGAVA